MYDDQSEKYKKHYSELKPVDIDKYMLIIGAKEVEEIKWLASLLQGKTWCHVNSTFEGGGVAEMLKSVVPIANGLGINCRWYSIEGNENFYSITKRFHNIIQGLDQHFTIEDLLDTYLETNKKNFLNKRIVADMTIVHDPQPCASIVHGNYEGKMIWRCHIDTSEANEMIWNFLLPYINNYDGSIFSQRSFVKPGIKKPVYQIAPAIDPLSIKNKQRSEKEGYDTLAPFWSKYHIDPDRPIVLAVSRYDVHKNQETIIKSFLKLKKDKTIRKLKPILIIVGNSATDDPEGMEMYRKIKEIAGNDKDIYTLLNIENNDEYIGALMKVAKIFVHISTKEGFGLVVTEALWQGTPVIGSSVGGIRLQVINGKTGYLVNPNNINSIVTFMKHLLTNHDEREKLGYNAVEHVRDNFLITTLVKKYLILMRFILGIDFPYFTI
ncbi:MAG: glycosyltransferase [Bacteroidales bacterium]|nr:glycosyltransferase [Bacteroidales bacterium]MBN2762021.1 glycosyltransferase [Bacteroidales bacterium]